ncbi:uncharacterized protein TRAVEDRAFT_53283 [Trametes versicolor FP-101664 SS1]|uniref:uncharacterized protein n=1 Tax=Trametes versicolor (strain FP-101664) TaxID=717944 RepID=UPI0004621A70|nr:uncharacterized protein TRAVEDRAFT_53283 [Trametes versicolor FP-101664 SS1]EIW52851.1 hypothetical protein TRAVEDRAFT_53283 [Trametes versicolor FP-101664 SS1]
MQELMPAAFGTAVLVDSLLTTTLVLALRQSRTVFKRTDSLITLLVMIMYAVNTGLLTGIFSFLSLIFALVLPTNLIYFALTVLTATTF